MTKRSITVRLEDGLDARPVALLVQEASKYESEELTVAAEGADEQTAVDNIEKFLSGQVA